MHVAFGRVRRKNRTDYEPTVKFKMGETLHTWGFPAGAKKTPEYTQLPKPAQSAIQTIVGFRYTQPNLQDR